MTVAVSVPVSGSGCVGVGLNSVTANAVQAGTFPTTPTQVEPVPAPTYVYYTTTGFDIGSIMNLMMQMFQMVLMIVFLLLPIKMLPELLSSLKGT